MLKEYSSEYWDAVQERGMLKAVGDLRARINTIRSLDVKLTSSD